MSNNLMWEIYWHYNDETFSHCSVTPIVIISEDDNGEIVARNANGDRFYGSKKNYYESQDIAWKAVQEDIHGMIVDIQEQQKALTDNMLMMVEYLLSLR